MQKKPILAMIFLFLSSSVMASTTQLFTGFYGNLGAGILQMNVQDDHTLHAVITDPINLTNVIDSTSPTVTHYVGTGLVSLGYAYTIKSFLISLEGRANIESSMDNTNTYFTDHTPGGVILSSQTSVKLQNDYNLLFRLGFLLRPKTLIYGIIGPSWGQFSISSNAEYSQTNMDPMVEYFGSLSQSKSEYQTGLLLGLGMEYLITNHWSFGIEYNHINFWTLNFPETLSVPITANDSTLNGQMLSVTNDINAKIDRAVLKLTYYL